MNVVEFVQSMIRHPVMLEVAPEVLHGVEFRCVRRKHRLRAYRFRLLVVESEAVTLDAGGWRSELKPAHVQGSLAAWIAQFELPIWLAGHHDGAAAFVERFLYQAARAVQTDYQAAAAFLEVADTQAVA